jgi:hypothetical protein
MAGLVVNLNMNMKLIELLTQKDAAQILTAAGASKEDLMDPTAIKTWRRANMHRLGLHPDLGGDHATTADINASVDLIAAYPLTQDFFKQKPVDNREEYISVILDFKQELRTIQTQKNHVKSVMDVNEFKYSIIEETANRIVIAFPLSEEPKFAWLRFKLGYATISGYKKIMK